MKKIKIMLTGIAVLAVVGGALAFKAQKFTYKKICIGTSPAPEDCNILKTNWRTTNIPTETFSYYTHITDGATNCAAVTDCPTQTYLKPE